MSLDSVVRARLFQWSVACDVWGFDIDPPFSAATLSGRAPGEVRFRAARTVDLGDGVQVVTLTVAEAWAGGEHPADRRLEQEGCHVLVLGWHVQVGRGGGALGAERLDVCDPDARHPRVHRHPFGQPNDVRIAAELPPPEAWLSRVNHVLDGALDDGFDVWDDLPDEEE